ncbi:proline-rich protein 1-like [Vigna angularis]|uniref:proline-rich protein 1-like n=1 Tax=Phaseolus angularis TaxID=3914 RepID=UPI0022B49E28|nr:proline-rich protein 1-like [Vigna angularis]
MVVIALVLVPATLPITTAPSPSSVGPTPDVHPPSTPVVHLPPTLAVHPPPTLVVNILPLPTPTPPVIITPTPPPAIITLTPPPVIITPTTPLDPTSIPSSSCIPSSETATPSTDLDSAGDGDGVDPPLYDRPWIEPYEFRNKCAKAQRNRASEKGGTLHTGGSITAQALGRAIHVDEVFVQTNVRKGTNQFEEFSTRLSQVRSEYGSAPTPDDANNEDDDIRRTQEVVETSSGVLGYGVTHSKAQNLDSN